MRHGQSAKWRLAVLVAVVGVHVLAGLLILATSTIRIARLRGAGAPPTTKVTSEIERGEHSWMH